MPSFFPRTGEHQARHYAFIVHDSTFECIVERLALTLSQERFAAILRRLTERILRQES